MKEKNEEIEKIFNGSNIQKRLKAKALERPDYVWKAKDKYIRS